MVALADHIDSITVNVRFTFVGRMKLRAIRVLLWMLNKLLATVTDHIEVDCPRRR